MWLEVEGMLATTAEVGRFRVINNQHLILPETVNALKVVSQCQGAWDQLNVPAALRNDHLPTHVTRSDDMEISRHRWNPLKSLHSLDAVDTSTIQTSAVEVHLLSPSH